MKRIPILAAALLFYVCAQAQTFRGVRIMQTVNSILVPTDFSVGSKRALAYAMQLADAFGASLQVIHVLEESFALAGYLEMSAASGDYLEARSAEVVARLS